MNITRLAYRARLQREAGAVAVELAMILLFLIGILALTFTFGGAIWQYNATKNATYGAVRYMVASGEWSTLPDGPSRQAATVAMFEKLAQESGLDTTDFNPNVTCSSGGCGTATFEWIMLGADFRIADPFGVVDTELVPFGHVQAINTD
jgi:Flp pilus assembly protein TadG